MEQTKGATQSGKKKRMQRGFLFLVVLFLSVQIFLFSHSTGTESGGISKGLTAFLLSLLQKLFRGADREKLFDILHVLVRKTAHFSLYFLLACSVQALARSYQLSIRKSALIAAGYSLLYAISDEIHQRFVPGRSGQITDVLIDFSGAAVGILVYCLLSYWYCRRKNKKHQF